jgi:hypothetical protein
LFIWPLGIWYCLNSVQIPAKNRKKLVVTGTSFAINAAESTASGAEAKLICFFQDAAQQNEIENH